MDFGCDASIIKLEFEVAIVFMVEHSKMEKPRGPTMQKSGRYLADVDHAEHEILSRFPEFIDNITDFLSSLGIYSRESWYLIEHPMGSLVSSLKGDIDVLTGPFEPKEPKQFLELLDFYRKECPDAHPLNHHRYAQMSLAWKGGLKWPPSLTYLIGIELKSVYLPLTANEITEQSMKSKKASASKIRGIRNETNKLLRMGFDKVGLFEFIANPPADGVGSQPWSRASYIAGSSLDAMENVFVGRLPETSPIGHGACSISGVNGRDECASGAFSFDTFRYAQINPFLEDRNVKANRKEMEQNLIDIFSMLPQPRTMPAVFIYDKHSHVISNANEVWIC
jgi:hypothetical protein